ncbi:MAG: sodium:solute symporter family protein [Flavobacteriales bacterium]|nr:sodium:solute symporter family protein [Flavobacteriales bacterium]
MHWIDASIRIVYMIALVAIGVYFMRKNTDQEDYFVGGRGMGHWHIGLSVVATDVGGGFSIGLGGLGFVMGLSGAWMLFTGLVGAWLAAVFLIPRVYDLARREKFLTFPQLIGHHYNGRAAFVAGIICAIGYLGFTSSQLLAGAKLASSAFVGLDMGTALLIMGAIIVGYTVMGGMKAVVYTDTVQWIVLIAGLSLVGLPMAWYAVGGWEGIHASVTPEQLSLTNVGPVTLINWMVTIVPIWFVGMTLYQRIYASRSERSAKKAWYIAGFLEWPLMAFMGVALGLLGRVAADQGLLVHLIGGDVNTMDPELGLPLLLRAVLPVGFLGLVLAAYFSAILSTADSCLMAASGNVLTDIVGRLRKKEQTTEQVLRFSQVLTLALGILAMVIAANMENVLSLMLASYAFMVSGLLVPLLAAVFLGKRNANAALAAMIGGGLTTILLGNLPIDLPLGLDPNVFGITTSAILFFITDRLFPASTLQAVPTPLRNEH